ncbi:GerMN domain-containing protein [Paenibacillus koleovorans]|uniref:GerMN domain-containing protein n=1 Tax=Paenibacillus koleovorans TaxID=121608 RepID=UPI000FDAAD13|nr:GerMN domain-containing protein [Paenibacillus koleovorans]
MLNKTIRRTAIPALLLLAISATGCGSKPTPAATPSTTPSPTPTATASQTVSPAPSPKQLKVKAYYADPEITKLVEKEATITYEADADKYRKAFQQLQTAPDTASVSLFKGVNVQSAALANGLLTANVTISDQGRLGAPGEALLLDALKKTMFQFSEVQSIELLVDGKKAETLMGHMDLPHPIKR